MCRWRGCCSSSVGCSRSRGKQRERQVRRGEAPGRRPSRAPFRACPSRCVDLNPLFLSRLTTSRFVYAASTRPLAPPPARPGRAQASILAFSAARSASVVERASSRWIGESSRRVARAQGKGNEGKKRSATPRSSANRQLTVRVALDDCRSDCQYHRQRFTQAATHSWVRAWCTCTASQGQLVASAGYGAGASSSAARDRRAFPRRGRLTSKGTRWRFLQQCRWRCG